MISNVSILKSDGSIESIVCENGSFEYVGYILNYFYKYCEKVKKLINYGDVYLLNKRLRKDEEITYWQDGVTIFFRRDLLDNERIKKVFNGNSEYENYLSKNNFNFIFLYDEGEGKWYYKDIKSYRILKNKIKMLGLDIKVDSIVNKIIWNYIRLEQSISVVNFNIVYESFDDAYYEVLDIFSYKEGIMNMIDVVNNYVLDFYDKKELELVKMAEDLLKEIKKYYKSRYNF